jgi:hypothetical protein
MSTVATPSRTASVSDTLAVIGQHFADRETVFALYPDKIVEATVPVAELVRRFPMTARYSLNTPMRPIAFAMIWSAFGGALTTMFWFLASLNQWGLPAYTPMAVGAVFFFAVGAAVNSKKSIYPFWVLVCKPLAEQDGAAVYDLTPLPVDIHTKDEKAQIMSGTFIGWMADASAWAHRFRIVSKATQKLELQAMIVLIGCVVGLIIFGLIAMKDTGPAAESAPKTSIVGTATPMPRVTVNPR